MKKKLITLFIFLSLIILFFIFYFFIFKGEIIRIDGKLKQDLLIKNISWNTPFLENVPCKKGEEIEFTIIFPGEINNKIDLDLSKIKEKLIVKKIFINEKEIGEKNIDINEGDSIKILGEAIQNGIIKKIDYKDIIKNIKKIDKEIIIENKIVQTNSGKINISLDKLKLNSNINNLVEIVGEGKNFLKYINIGGISLTPIKENNKVFITISKNTFISGEYFIIAQFENGDLITLNDKITFLYSDSIVNIANITPIYIKNDVEKYIVLQGNGFEKVISIQLSNNVILKTTSFDIINDNVLSVKIPAGLEAGNYYFNIMTVDGITELKNNIFTIYN